MIAYVRSVLGLIFVAVGEALLPPPSDYPGFAPNTDLDERIKMSSD